MGLVTNEGQKMLDSYARLDAMMNGGSVTVGCGRNRVKTVLNVSPADQEKIRVAIVDLRKLGTYKPEWYNNWIRNAFSIGYDVDMVMELIALSKEHFLDRGSVIAKGKKGRWA